MSITFGSLFAGIGGLDLGLERAGMVCRWQVEIDDKCRGVLARHWPTVDRIKDVRDVGRGTVAAVDLVCGGFPCQDVSVAGRRAGLAGERSGLFYEFTRILADLAPRWVLVENVPGLLSSNRGRDMGAVVGALAELGYGWAYRVLDAQYFGVAQRRRRVFIVGCLGDARRAGQVLFEPESLPGDTPPSRAQRQEIAGTLGGGAGRRGWCDDTDRSIFVPVAFDLAQVTSPDNRSKPEPGDPCRPLHTFGETPCVAFTERTRKDGRNFEAQEELAYALTNPGSGGRTHSRQLVQGMVVRRLMPVECERLQGFPDGHTAGEADSARYRQLGNAVCVPVAEWIGRRIVEAAEGK